MFPILMLPLLVFTNVLRHMGSFEFFKLTLCSKRSSKVVRGVTGKNKKTRTLYFEVHDDRVLVRVCYYLDYTENWDLTVKRLPTNHKTRADQIGYKITENDIEMYWEDPVRGFKTMLRYVFRFFNAKEIEVDLHGNWEGWVEVIKWLRKRELAIGQAILKGITENADLSSIFDQSEAVNFTIIEEITASQDFIQNNIRSYENNLLTIQYGRFVTLPRLLTMNCIELMIGTSSLTSADCNAFLKHWIRGGSPRINKFYLRVDDGRVDLEVAMAGIVFQENRQRRVYSLLFNYPPSTIPRDIRRFDGTIATVFVGRGRDQFELQVCES